MSTDLSGCWRGLFSYTGGSATTGFLADLIDTGGLLSGIIVEPNVFSQAMLPIEAAVDGRRDGSAVRFAKFYDDPAGNYDTVSYAGTVDGSGNEISGRWDIPGDWSGTFVMVRAALPIAAQRDEDAADAPVTAFSAE